jgi:hypothetical protein
MSGREVSVFFYGSYLNRAVLAEVELAPERWDHATIAAAAVLCADSAVTLERLSLSATSAQSRAHATTATEAPAGPETQHSQTVV